MNERSFIVKYLCAYEGETFHIGKFAGTCQMLGFVQHSSGERRLPACCRRQPADDIPWVVARCGIERSQKFFGKLPKRTGLPRRIRPVADWQPVLRSTLSSCLFTTYPTLLPRRVATSQAQVAPARPEFHKKPAPVAR